MLETDRAAPDKWIAPQYIWCLSPLLRAVRVALGALGALTRAVSHATLAPVAEALGHACAGIRVRVHNAHKDGAVASPKLAPLLP